MKLLYCKQCGDVFSLSMTLKSCSCDSTSGKYTNNLDAIYYGESAIPLGFTNDTFNNALSSQPESGQGKIFTAFVIPKICPTFIKKSNKDKILNSLENVPDYGNIYPIKQFEDMINDGWITDDDGDGYYGIETETSYKMSREHDCFDKKPDWSTHIIWFNK